MKKLTRILWLSFALAVVVPTVPMFVTGCKTQSTQTVAYNSLATVGQTVNSAYSAYIDLVIKKSVSTNQVESISRAYNTFQQGFSVAVAAARFSLTNAAPVDLQAQANNLIIQISAAK